MAEDVAQPKADESAPITSIRVLFARLFWSTLGPLVLVGLSFGIVKTGSGWLTTLDLLFGIVVLLVLAARALGPL